MRRPLRLLGLERFHYDFGFFRALRTGSLASARVIVPIVLDLLGPKSVVDVGCGIGTWLSVFQEFGVSDVVGVDGDYVDRDQLLIEPARFFPHDLEKPLRLERSFDLAISLEVAEHLAPEAAATFVESLVRLAPAVLFSAAIPEQGGAGHLNEQWPGYWATLFAHHGYQPIDCVRHRVWSESDVEVWYAQNTLLYIKRSEITRHASLAPESRPAANALARVHPRLYLAALADAPNRLTTRTLVAALPRSVLQTIRWRIRGLLTLRR
jgi:SAM-dependent methyltransferase